jgi:DNA-directed RNA polymerase subunit RPC12/RpoP
MPSTSFLCPHCSKHVEVQLTSVTRTRRCPQCGNLVVLQTGAKEKKLRALLVGGSVMPDAGVDKPLMPAYEPQVIQGEVFERLKLDPEVREFRNKLIMGVAVTLGLIVLAVVGEIWSMPDPVPPPVVVKVAAEPAPMGELVFENSALPAHGAERAEAAQAVARKFLATTSAAERLEVVSEPEQWEAAIKRSVLMKPLKPLPVISLTVEEPESPTATAVVVKAALLGDQEVVLQVVWRSGRALIDWPSSVGWSPVEWADLMQQPPQGAVTQRVLAELAENYTQDFAESEVLLCVKLSDPMLPASPPIYAYAKRDSTVAKQLSSLLQQQRRTQKLTLSLRYPGNAKSRDQVWVDQVMASSWFDPTATSSGPAVGVPR